MVEQQEYCLLWSNWWGFCLTKTEWASWVQAIGSIAAIGLAVALGRSAERAQKRLAASKTVAYASAARAALHHLQLVTNSGVAVDNVALARVALEAFAELRSGIRLDLLPLEVVGSVLSLYTVAAQTQEGCRHFEAAVIDAQRFRNLVNSSVQKVEAMQQIFEKLENRRVFRSGLFRRMKRAAPAGAV